MRNRGAPAPTAAVWLLALPGCVAVAAAAAAYAVGRPGSSATELAWDIAWTAGGVGALAGTLLARRAAAASHRARWTLWAGAAASWLVGQLAWDAFGITGMPASPNLADAGWWGFALLVIVSLIRFGARSRSVRIVSMTEMLPVIGAAVALTLSTLWHRVIHSPVALAPRVSALAYAALYVSAAVLMVQVMVGGALSRARSNGWKLVLGGMVAEAIAFSLWSGQLLDGRYVVGATAIDPLWLAGLLMITAGSLLATLRPLAASELDEPSRRGGLLPTVTFVLLLAALVKASLTGGPSTSGAILGAGLLFSGLALILRNGLLERRLRDLLAHERATLATLADREEELARRNQQLLEDSRRDPLTGMRNRRALSDDLPELESVHRSRGDGLAFALCDVDHFKAYNDLLGHLAGDQALRAIAATIRGALRAGDLAYRFGGEELLLILRDTSVANATSTVERVREAVERVAIPHPNGIGGVLTISIGLAAGREGSADLLRCADTALYEAKQSGRNRVVAVAAGAGAPAGPGRARSSVSEEPVPRHLRSMLALSRAAAAGHGIGPVLDALTETIRAELSFQVVAVRLLDATSGLLRCVAVLGDDEAREVLLGTANPWHEWEWLIGSEHDRGGAIWLPAGSHEWKGETVLWTPAHAPALDPDAWHPEDMLMLPLRDGAGEILGLVSVDQPLGGRRPGEAELATLMAITDHAGLALEQARRDSVRAAADDRRSSELLLAAVMLLADTLDLRDQGTGRHSRTVGAYARQTAVALGLSAERVERIHAAGVLHDLGKLGIADAILHKPDPLDEDEWREMRRHPEIGARILEHAGLRDIASWVLDHHERLDGRGYPNARAAEEIGLEARILAVADAYEAMVADRPYRIGMAPEEAAQELRRCAGAQFDPAVVEAFLGALAPESTAPPEPEGEPAGEVTAEAAEAAVGLGLAA